MATFVWPDQAAGQWIPVREIAAAAGNFSADQAAEQLGWVPRSGKGIADGSFLAQVSGHSMEPTIPDGSWCLFRPMPAGSREGRVVLVVHHAISDPEHGGRYTVKRYRSQKAATSDSWRHTGISLLPDNPAFTPIEIDPKQAEDMRLVAEFVRVWSRSTGNP